MHFNAFNIQIILGSSEETEYFITAFFSELSDVFFFRFRDVRYAAYERLDTHLGLKSKDAFHYLDKYIDDTFIHYDTGGTEEIYVTEL